MPSNTSVDTGLALLKNKNESSKVLGVTIGKHVVKPGLHVPKADAQQPPELSFDVPNPDGTYLVVSLDLDAPSPSFTLLGPILHWIQPGLKPQQTDGKVVLKATEPFIANYIGPAPPPGSSPHRYIFFLYEQPAGFDVKAHAPPNGGNLGNLKRIRYSLDKWAKEVGLGAILAANYFTSN